MRIFQTILLLIFAAAAVIAVLLFSGILSPGGLGGRSAPVSLSIWGSLPESRIEPFINDFNQRYRDNFNLKYVFVPAGQFEAQYLDSLARDTNPDLIFFTDDMIVRYADTARPLPLETFSARDFQDTFTEGSQIFLRPDGVLALPIASDPLVMYVNKDLYTNAGLALVPKTWTDLIQTLGKLNNIDKRNNILASALAMGEFSNNKNAKAILEMLIMQSGNPIVTATGGNYQVVLEQNFGFALSPGVAALNFFTNIADQSRTTFSWNKAMPEAMDAFAAGVLANYLGFASDLPLLRSKNPNLNLDVSVVPQRGSSDGQLTKARQLGLAVVKKSTRIEAAFQVALLLSSKVEVAKLTTIIGLPPVRRDLLSVPPTDAFSPVFYASSLIGRTWPDPNPLATEAIFKNMAEAALLKRSAPEKAVTDADDQLTNLFRAR